MKYTVTVKNIVDSNLRKVPFGHEFYSPPKVEKNRIPGRAFKIGKEKPSNFADLEAKNKSFIPGPHYNTMLDWNKTTKGKFLKGQK